MTSIEMAERYEDRLSKLDLLERLGDRYQHMMSQGIYDCNTKDWIQAINLTLIGFIQEGVLDWAVPAFKKFREVSFGKEGIHNRYDRSVILKDINAAEDARQQTVDELKALDFKGLLASA